MADSFAVARMSNVLGVSTTFVLDPSKITTRIKNAAKKMLADGVLVGGYRSQARKIAKISATLHGLPIVTDSSRRYLNINVTPREIVEPLCELLRADTAAYMLVEPEHAYYRNNPSKWQERLAEQKERTNTAIKNMRSGRPAWAQFHDEALHKQALEIIAKHHKSHLSSAIERISKWLDAGEPRVIPDEIVGVV